MKKKKLKGMPKRIVAFMLAVLMVLSLIPINDNRALAAEGEYTFTIQDAEKKPIVGATVNVYEQSTEGETEQESIASGTSIEDGTVTLKIVENKTISDDCTYTVTCEGYNSKIGTISTDKSVDNSIVVTLEVETTENEETEKKITINGKVSFPAEGSEENTGSEETGNSDEGTTDETVNPYEGITAALYKVQEASGDENIETVSEDSFAQSDVNKDGEYSFANVPVGSKYVIKITAADNVYKTVELEVDLTSVDENTTEYSVLNGESTTLVASIEAVLTFEEEYVVYIGGNSKTIVPAVTVNEEVQTEGYKITYETEDTDNITLITEESSNNIKIAIKEGVLEEKTIKVTATLKGENFVSKTISFNVLIKNKNASDGFDFISDEITKNVDYEVPFTEDEEFFIDASAGIKGEETYGIEYWIEEIEEEESVQKDDEEVAVIDSTGKITINKVGTVKVYAKLPGGITNDPYNDTTISFKLIVNPIKQEKSPSFTQKETYGEVGSTLSFDYSVNNNSYDFSATTAESNAEIFYSVSADETGTETTIASIDGNGMVTVSGVGTFIVTAIAKKDNYSDETISYTVKIEKGNPDLEFSEDEFTLINGEFDFTKPDLTSSENESLLTSVKYSENSELITIDPDTGEITFDKLKTPNNPDETITITATRAEDDKYSEQTVTYTIIIKDWNPDASAQLYDITDSEGKVISGWHGDNTIQIVAKEGYSLSKGPQQDSESWDNVSWSDKLQYEELQDGIANTCSFYIKNAETGAISGIVKTEDIKIDTKPATFSINDKDDTNKTFAEWLLYIFKGEHSFAVNIKPETNVAPYKIYYYVSTAMAPLTEPEEIEQLIETEKAKDKENNKENKGWQELLENELITLPENNKGVIYAKVVDEAGNIAYANTNGLIADNTAPSVTAKPNVEPHGEFYSRDFNKLTVTVNDGEISSGIKTIEYWFGDDENNKTTVDIEKINDEDDRVASPDKTTSDGQLFKNYEFDIENIDASEYNTEKGLIVHVRVVDNAGCDKTHDLTYKIYIPKENKPCISVSNDMSLEPNFTIDGVSYYDESRNVTVTFAHTDKNNNDRKDVFKKDNVQIEITVDGKPYDYSKLKWDENGEPVVKIPFTDTGKYTLSINYKDKAEYTADSVTDTFVIDMMEPTVNLTVDAPHNNEIYNKDFNVQIAVDDTAVTSGLKEVTYSVKCDGVVTKTETWTLGVENPAILEDIQQKLEKAIVVSAKDNNSSNVVVEVKATDYFGETTTKKTAVLDIDVTAPTIEVSYSDQDTTPNVVGTKGYFDKGRTATITVAERTTHFDKDAFMKNIKITATDAKGKDVANAVPAVTYVGITPGTTENDAKHVFTIKYTADANYTFSASCTDKAGWTCADKNITSPTGTVTPKSFAIDTKAPTGSIKVADLGVWDKLLQTITFGLWSPSDVDIEMTADDVTSPIASIQYYKTSTFTALTKTDLDAVITWTDYSKFSVSKDDIFVIYGKITDNAGHVEYISSNGIVVDETKPVFETFSPEITLSPQQPVNGIYNDDVTVDVKVVDPKKGENNAYSGLKEIRYEVYNLGEKTQSGTLYKFNKEDPTQNQLKQSWDAKDIVVDAEKNNSNKVVVKVFATDNAGNNSNKSVSLKIDMTKPIIEVSYDNNEGDTTFEDNVYYNSKRVATIKVTERNFDASKVKVTITNSDGKVPKISEWTTKKGSGNGDNAVHTAKITYSADGDYTFKISMKDKAGNANKGVKYGDSQAPKAFTIDKTKPVISVSYDNNEAMNDNYYKTDRTATITIQEHNFDDSRVEATITATDNGENVAVPSISRWSKSGDTYTATINYTDDAMYTFAMAYIDMAGNEAEAIEEQNFYVDKTAPVMSIKGVVDETANSEDTISLVITVTDTNFSYETCVPKLVGTVENNETIDVELIPTGVNNGYEYKVSNIPYDGIYQITCSLVDMAGNEYTNVTLYEKDGSTYVENRTAEDTLMSFSVNRDGSVFEVDKTTEKVLDNYYVHDVKEDITIIETNTDSLSEQSITLNGETLKEGVDYKIRTEGGNGKWMRYLYVIDKSLFVEEGEYTIVVSSVDKAENNAFSDIKDTKISFVVDRTAPVVTISGMETGGRYQTDNQTVTLIPTDDGGAIGSIVIYQVDKDGNIIGEPLMPELSGDALIEQLEANDGMIEFNLPNGNYDYIQVVCSDSCVNEKGEPNVARILIEDVRISASAATLYMGDLVAPIAIGSVVVLAAVVGIVINKKKKSNKIK